MAPNTQIGRLIIEDQNDPTKRYSKNEHQDMFTNDDEEAKYSRGGEFLENLMSSNILEFCWRWMNLGDIFDVISDIEEFYSFNSYNGPSINDSINTGIYNIKDKYIQGIISNNYRITSGIIFDNDLDKSNNDSLIKEIKKGAIL